MSEQSGAEGWRIWEFENGFMIGNDRQNPIAFPYHYEAITVLELLKVKDAELAALRQQVAEAEARYVIRGEILIAAIERAERAEADLEHALAGGRAMFANLQAAEAKCDRLEAARDSLFTAIAHGDDAHRVLH